MWMQLWSRQNAYNSNVIAQAFAISPWLPWHTFLCIQIQNYSQLRPQQLHPKTLSIRLSFPFLPLLASPLHTRISEWPLDLNIYTVAGYAAS